MAVGASIWQDRRREVEREEASQVTADAVYTRAELARELTVLEYAAG